MSCVFQNIDPPPSCSPGECVPPAFVAGGGHTRRVKRGVGGQYFVRRKTQLCARIYRSSFGRENDRFRENKSKPLVFKSNPYPETPVWACFI
jgi:hypothetical protein